MLLEQMGILSTFCSFPVFHWRINVRLKQSDSFWRLPSLFKYQQRQVPRLGRVPTGLCMFSPFKKHIRQTGCSQAHLSSRKRARFCSLGQWPEQQVQRVLHRFSVTHEKPSHPAQFTLLLYNGGIISLCQSVHHRASLATQMAHPVLCINYISKYCSVWIESLNLSCFSGRSV